MELIHGIETVDLPQDFAPARTVATSVIGLIGTSNGDIANNELVLTTTERGDAVFGDKGTLPAALRAIRQNQSRKGGAVVIVNKIGSHTDTITPAQVIGAVSATNVRTGLKLFEVSNSKFGLEPMIYDATSFSSLGAVTNELRGIAYKNEAMAYINTPSGYTFGEAIAARQPNGDFSNLDGGCKLLFPHLLYPNVDYIDADQTPDVDRFIAAPFSSYAAGLRSRIDMDFGWHYSSSNHPIFGVARPDVDLTFGIGDPTCEVHMLNAQGVTTAAALPGLGLRVWGNYTAGFPGNTTVDMFEAVRRTRAIMKRTLVLSASPFLSIPLIQAHIDMIRNTVQQYLNVLMAQKRIVFGECTYRLENNPIGQLAAGHVTFDIEFTPCIPMQKMTFNFAINLDQLLNIS